MSALLRSWAQRSGLVCYLAGEHQERRVPEGTGMYSALYNRECTRCFARRLAPERKRKSTKEA